MPTLFKEEIAGNVVEMSVCDGEIYVFHYKADGAYDVKKYEASAYAMGQALDWYNEWVSELLQREAAKAEEEGLYDDGFEFPDHEE